MCENEYRRNLVIYSEPDSNILHIKTAQYELLSLLTWHSVPQSWLASFYISPSYTGSCGCLAFAHYADHHFSHCSRAVRECREPFLHCSSYMVWFLHAERNFLLDMSNQSLAVSTSQVFVDCFNRTFSKEILFSYTLLLEKGYTNFL